MATQGTSFGCVPGQNPAYRLTPRHQPPQRLQGQRLNFRLRAESGADRSGADRSGGDTATKPKSATILEIATAGFSVCAANDPRDGPEEPSR